MIYYPKKLTNSLANSNKAIMLIKLRYQILIMPVTMTNNCEEKIEEVKKQIDRLMNIDLSICYKSPEPTKINSLFGEKFENLTRFKELKQDIKAYNYLLKEVIQKRREYYSFEWNTKKWLIKNIILENDIKILFPKCLEYYHNIKREIKSTIEKADTRYSKEKRKLRKELDSILKPKSC